MNRLARLIVVLAALPDTALAASGQFTFVTGPVTLQKANGTRSVPGRGTPVDPGDRIVTGANAMVQLTMVDEARISLRPSRKSFRSCFKRCTSSGWYATRSVHSARGRTVTVESTPTISIARGEEYIRSMTTYRCLTMQKCTQRIRRRDHRC